MTARIRTVSTPSRFEGKKSAKQYRTKDGMEPPSMEAEAAQK
jgi:hypothetical protein